MKKFLLTLLLLSASAWALENLEGKPVFEIEIAADARCPIKGVLLAPHRDWLGVVQFKDGTLALISSPKYAFGYLYTESLKNPAGVHALYLTDHATKRLVHSANAYYVFGSTVMGVGGDDIIPFENEADAQAFKEAHSGKQIYRLERINKRFIDYLEMR